MVSLSVAVLRQDGSPNDNLKTLPHCVIKVLTNNAKLRAKRE